MLRRSIAKSLSFLLLALAAQAHVGSPDVFLDAKAGPYQLFVTIRPPDVIPGVAELQVRSQTPGVSQIQVVPLPITGQAVKLAPVSDKLARSAQDPQFFTGSLWIMAAGSWQVRITVSGTQGSGVLAVPLPAAALLTKPMQRGLGVLLSVLMLFLVGGLVAIVGANTREAKLAPGASPDARHRRQARIAMSIAFAVLIGIVWLGNRWWAAVEASYRGELYKPMQMAVSLDPRGVLTLALHNPDTRSETETGWGAKFFSRGVDDLLPDHNHLMHLYAIRQPGLDVVFHLHPERTGPGIFHLALPSMPAGNYKLYADVVHANGFPETLVATVNIPALSGRPLSGDDAAGTASPWNLAAPSTVFALPDGYRMEWLRDDGELRAKQPTYFRFRLLDSTGHPARDIALYMGMPGHAAFVKTDGAVFAHVHPTGSISMAAFMLAQQAPMSSMDMSAMNAPPTSPLPAEVSFPYGFPTPGLYRIIVQVRHGNMIETGVFDTEVR